MRRRDFIACLGGAAVTWPLAARAQQRDQISRVGVLINAPENVPQIEESLTAFRKELGRLGWSEGHNIRFDIHFTQGDMGTIQELARAMAASQPDVVLAHTTTFVAAMQKQTSTIPIVFVNASDPIGSGFIASLARPGGNLTGLLLYESSIVGKWLGMLKEIAPQTARVAFVANPKVEIYAYFLKEAQRVRTVAEDRGGSKPGPVFGRYRARYRRVHARCRWRPVLSSKSCFRFEPRPRRFACGQIPLACSLWVPLFPGKGGPYVLRRR